LIYLYRHAEEITETQKKEILIIGIARPITVFLSFLHVSNPFIDFYQSAECLYV